MKTLSIVAITAFAFLASANFASAQDRQDDKFQVSRLRRKARQRRGCADSRRSWGHDRAAGVDPFRTVAPAYEIPTPALLQRPDFFRMGLSDFRGWHDDLRSKGVR
jgi:hypothetical protein